MLVKGLEYDVRTKQMIEKEIDIDIPNPRIAEIQERMKSISSLLSQSDFRTIKRFEGDMTDDIKWNQHVAERKALRSEYNSIEQELKTLI